MTVTKTQTDSIVWKLVKQIVVPGEPVAKGRPRLARRGRFTRAYTPLKTVRYEKDVAMFCHGKMLPPEQPIRIRMRMIWKRPKRLMRKKDPDGLIPKLTKPDGDNVEKAVLDGMNGVVFNDDAQVFGNSWTKWYSEKDGAPRVEIEIYTLKPTTENEEESQ